MKNVKVYCKPEQHNEALKMLSVVSGLKVENMLNTGEPVGVTCDSKDMVVSRFAENSLIDNNSIPDIKFKTWSFEKLQRKYLKVTLPLRDVKVYCDGSQDGIADNLCYLSGESKRNLTINPSDFTGYWVCDEGEVRGFITGSPIDIDPCHEIKTMTVDEIDKLCSLKAKLDRKNDPEIGTSNTQLHMDEMLTIDIADDLIKKSRLRIDRKNDPGIDTANTQFESLSNVSPLVNILSMSKGHEVNPELNKAINAHFESLNTVKPRVNVVLGCQTGKSEFDKLINDVIRETSTEFTKPKLTPERQGWEFMVSLKLARSQQGEFNDDDYVDLAGYIALLAEHLCSQG